MTGDADDRVKAMLAAAEKQLTSIIERKEKNTAGPSCNESLYQHASGMIHGAREIILAIENAIKTDGLRRVWRNLDGTMSFKMGPHCCVAHCPCQLKPGESQPSIASMADYDAYAAVYPRRDGESDYVWQSRIIKDERRFDFDSGPAE